MKKIAFFGITHHVLMMGYELRKKGYHVLINKCDDTCELIISSTTSSYDLWKDYKNKYKLPVVEWCWDLPNWRSWGLSLDESKSQMYRDKKNAMHVEHMKKSELVLCASHWVRDVLHSFGINAIQMNSYIDTDALDKIKYLDRKSNDVIQISRLCAPNKRFEDTVKALSVTEGLSLKLVGYDPVKYLTKLGMDKYISKYVNISPCARKLTAISKEMNFKKMSIIRNASQEDRVLELKKSKLLVSPQSEDGWGMTPLEAIYCKVPIVTSNLRNYQDMFGKNVKYSKVFDYRDLASKIRWMFNNPNFSNDQIEALTPFVKSLNVSSATDRYIEILESYDLL